jgi:hypothetical protein
MPMTDNRAEPNGSHTVSSQSRGDRHRQRQEQIIRQISHAMQQENKERTPEPPSRQHLGVSVVRHSFPSSVLYSVQLYGQYGRQYSTSTYYVGQYQNGDLAQISPISAAVRNFQASSSHLCINDYT